VRASERSGRVPEALEEFARYDASLRELRRKMINAAIYPSLVVGFGFLVSLFLLGYVVPRFAQIFAERVEQTSRATGLLIRLARRSIRIPGGLPGACWRSSRWSCPLAANPKVRIGLVHLIARIGPVERWLRTLQTGPDHAFDGDAAEERLPDARGDGPGLRACVAAGFEDRDETGHRGDRVRPVDQHRLEPRWPGGRVCDSHTAGR